MYYYPALNTTLLWRALQKNVAFDQTSFWEDMISTVKFAGQFSEIVEFDDFP